MAIAYENNTDLAFDTEVLRKAAGEYRNVADDLRRMASKLDGLLANLAASGWTTPAGSAFRQITDTSWRQNIEKYASLLDTLNDILLQSAQEYDNLMTYHVRRTKLNYQD